MSSMAKWLICKLIQTFTISFLRHSPVIQLRPITKIDLNKKVTTL